MADVAASQSTQIAQFAATRLGQQVGDGQCFALADQALQSIGVKSASDFGSISASADYIWGREVALEQARVGDVIQFRNYNYEETITTHITYEDGSSEESTETQTDSRPHHTAIIASVGSQGQLMVYEQNVNSQMLVQHNRLLFSQLTIGPTITTSGGTTTTVTRRITVTGRTKFYRAQTR